MRKNPPIFIQKHGILFDGNPWAFNEPRTDKTRPLLGYMTFRSVSPEDHITRDHPGNVRTVLSGESVNRPDFKHEPECGEHPIPGTETSRSTFSGISGPGLIASNAPEASFFGSHRYSIFIRDSSSRYEVIQNIHTLHTPGITVFSVSIVRGWQSIESVIFQKPSKPVAGLADIFEILLITAWNLSRPSQPPCRVQKRMIIAGFPVHGPGDGCPIRSFLASGIFPESPCSRGDEHLTRPHQLVIRESWKTRLVISPKSRIRENDGEIGP